MSGSKGDLMGASVIHAPFLAGKFLASSSLLYINISGLIFGLCPYFKISGSGLDYICVMGSKVLCNIAIMI